MNNTKPIKRELQLSKLTGDEIHLMLLVLAQFESQEKQRADRPQQAARYTLSPTAPKEIVRFGSATFYRLRYKLEHRINPKAL